MDEREAGGHISEIWKGLQGRIEMVWDELRRGVVSGGREIEMFNQRREVSQDRGAGSE